MGAAIDGPIGHNLAGRFRSQTRAMQLLQFQMPMATCAFLRLIVPQLDTLIPIPQPASLAALMGGEYFSYDATTCVSSCDGEGLINSGETECVSGCGSGEYISSDETKCVSECASDEFISSDAKACVPSCDGQYISSDAKTCVSSCDGEYINSENVSCTSSCPVSQ